MLFISTYPPIAPAAPRVSCVRSYFAVRGAREGPHDLDLVRDHVRGEAPATGALELILGRRAANRAERGEPVPRELIRHGNHDALLYHVMLVERGFDFAYANGQRLKSKNGPKRKLEEYSDPDASWGIALR
jgi:hypothetical protein